MDRKMAGVMERLDTLETNREPTTACKDGWMAYKGSCYYFGNTEVTFTTAEVLCRSLGAHLVSVDNHAENKFLKGFMHSHRNSNIHYWLGITDEEKENVWKLLGGNTVATFFDWNSRTEPKGGTVENCASFAAEHQYHWGDIMCSSLSRYLCEQS